MKCPTEFTCSLFADGELPEGEARELARHLESCEACEGLVAALRAESRVLVQCLQDVDLEEPMGVPKFSSTRGPVGIFRFALGVIGAALAFRISTGILFGLGLPEELAWLDPRGWVLTLSVALNAVAYAVENAGGVVAGTAQGVVLFTLGAAALIVMARILSKSAAASSIFAVLVAIGVCASSSYAVDIRKGASVPAGETINDTLVMRPSGGRGSLDIAGTVKGDLFAVGDVVTVSGTVEGNVVAFARRVEISGTVVGTLIGAAQTVSVSGRVGQNLIAAGGVVNIGRSSDVGGNVVAASGESVIEGSAQKDLIVTGGVLDLRGNVGRNALFYGGQASLTQTARIGGDLEAHVDKEENVTVAAGAVIGGKKNVLLNRVVPGPSRYMTVRYYIWQVVRILAAFVTGLVLFRLFPALVPSRIVSGMDWLKAGGVGFIALVTVPIAIIIVGITVIGLPIALLSLAVYLAGLYVAKIIVAEFVGRSLMKAGGAVPLLAGLFVVVVSVNLPWIGGLINFLLCLLGLGALAVTVYQAGFRRQAVEL